MIERDIFAPSDHFFQRDCFDATLDHALEELRQPLAVEVWHRVEEEASADLRSRKAAPAPKARSTFACEIRVIPPRPRSESRARRHSA